MKTKEAHTMPSSLSCGNLPLDTHNHTPLSTDTQGKKKTKLRRSLGGKINKRKFARKHASLPNLTSESMTVLSEGTTDNLPRSGSKVLTKDAGRTPKVPRKMMVRMPDRFAQEDVNRSRVTLKEINQGLLDDSGSFLEDREVMVKFTLDDKEGGEAFAEGINAVITESINKEEKNDQQRNQVSTDCSTPEKSAYMIRNAGSTPKVSRIKEIDPSLVLDIMKNIGNEPEFAPETPAESGKPVLRGSEIHESRSLVKKISTTLAHALRPKEQEDKKTTVTVKRKKSISLLCGLSKSKLVASFRNKDSMPKNKPSRVETSTPKQEVVCVASSQSKSKFAVRKRAFSGQKQPVKFFNLDNSVIIKDDQAINLSSPDASIIEQLTMSPYNAKNTGAGPKEADFSLKNEDTLLKTENNGQGGKTNCADVDTADKATKRRFPLRSKSMKCAKQQTIKSAKKSLSLTDLNKHCQDSQPPKSALKHSHKAMMSSKDDVFKEDLTPSGVGTRAHTGKRVLIPDRADSVIQDPPRKRPNLLRRLSSRRHSRKEAIKKGEDVAGQGMIQDAGHTPRTLKRKEGYNERLIE